MRVSRSATGLVAGAASAALAMGCLIGVPVAHAAPGDIDLGASDAALAAAASSSGGIFAFAGNTIIVSLGPATLTGATTTRNVVISGAGVAVTLNNATVGATAVGAAIGVTSGSTTLTLTGTSTLTGTTEYPGLGIAAGATVAVAAASTGILAVQGTGKASGIGGDGKAVNVDPQAQPPTIIGGAAATCGSLTVAGGTLVATHGTGPGAAIGGGVYGNGCSVTVSGGEVQASTSGSGAAIGGAAGEEGVIADYGYDSPGGAGGAVVVTGGTMTATAGSDGSPAIGGGRGGRASGPTTPGTDGAPGTLSVRGGSAKITGTSGPAAPITGGASGSAAVAVARVPAVGVTSVQVTGTGDFHISANHPGDSTVYLYLPHSLTGTEQYTVVVDGSAGTKTYNVAYRTSGDPTVSEVGAETRVLSVAAPAFASITEGDPQPAAQGVVLQNTGTGALAVSSVVSSAPAVFAVTGGGPVSVAGGATNSTGFQVRPAAGLAVGTHTATLTATYDGTGGTTATATVSIVVTAGSTPPPETRVLSLSVPAFASIVEGDPQPAAQGVVLRSTGSGELSVSSVTSSAPAVFAVTGTGPVSIPGGVTSAAWFQVRPAAGLAVGTHTATLTATYDGTSGTTATATVSITVTAGSTPPPETRVLSMSMPMFAPIVEGDPQPAAQDVVLRNTGSGALAVSLVASSDPDVFSVTGTGPVSIPSGATNTTGFRVRPAAALAAGTHTVTLTATYDGTSGTTATTTVSIVVTAAPLPPPETRVLVMSVPAFAAMAAGGAQPAAQGVVLQSTGNRDLAVSSVVSSDPAVFAVTGTGPVSIPSGATNTTGFQVRPAAGLAAGTHTVTLTATYNGTSGTRVTTTVSITVTAPPGGGGTPPGQGNDPTTPPTTTPPAVTPPPATGPPAVNPPAKVKPALTAKLAAAKVVRTKAAQIRITLKAKGIAKPTGKIKVTVKKGSKTVKTKTYTLAAKSKGKATLKLPKLPKGTYTVTVAYRGSATIAAKTATISKKLQVR